MASWLDRVNNDFTITTGDGKTYTPKWMKATKEKEFNIAEFEFPEVEGTLVYRSLSKGRRYNIEIYFQGDDHLDVASNFDISSDDPRAWKISHPYYGLITVQPLGLSFDNSKMNVSEITGTLVETITEENPQGSLDPIDSINFNKNQLDLTVQTNLGNQIPPLQITPILQNQMLSQVQSAYQNGLPIIRIDTDATEYFNAFTKVNAAITGYTTQASNALIFLSDLYNSPINFTTSVKNRITTLTNQFNSVRTNVMTLLLQNSPNLTPKAKTVYENAGVTIISAAAVASVTNMDYNNRNDIIAIIEAILALYQQLLADLDALQSANAGSTTSYVPDANSLIELNSLLNQTVSSLFTVGLSSKQERILYCEWDTNLILLAHRLYGLLPDDSTIQTLMDNNEIGLSELLEIKKGRKIIYYV